MPGGRSTSATGSSNGPKLFEPAVHYAEQGVPVPEIIAHYIRGNLKVFLRPGAGIEETDNAIRTYGMGQGGPQTGQIFRNPDLARTYRMIAQGGRDVFYKGEIAKTIEAYFKRIGGWMTVADLAAHHSEWGRAAPDRLSRRHRPRAGRQHAGHRDAADAQHARAFRHAWRWLPVAAVDPPPGRGQAPRL